MVVQNDSWANLKILKLTLILKNRKNNAQIQYANFVHCIVLTV